MRPAVLVGVRRVPSAAPRRADAWAQRLPNTPLRSPEEALILASIIEKETGQESDRARVGGVFIVVLVVMAVFALLTGGKSLIPANLLGMLRAMSSIASR